VEIVEVKAVGIAVAARVDTAVQEGTDNKLGAESAS